HAAESVDGRIFVGNELGDSVSVISARKVAGRAAGFAQPGGLAGVGGDVAVVDVRASTLTLIDGRTLRPLGTQPAGAGPTHAVGDRAGHIFVVDTRGNAVESFAAFPRLRLRARVALNGTPYGVALDSRRGRLWVTLTATNQLAELAVDGGAPRLLAVYSTGRQANTVAVDPVTGTVFVA